jgi:hypothetical protein
VGRPTKNGQPMTAAERQARRRKRVGKSINRRRRTLRKLAKESAGREVTRQRREASLNAAPLPDGAEYRKGDCREVLSDIAPESVALIVTDPPYEDGAEPLWRWLAQWALEVLMPGGSLICYFGSVRVNCMYRILDDAGLEHWCHAVMQHDQSQRLLGRSAIISCKPILWYTKGHRRSINGRVSLVPNVVSSTRDKSAHPWAQGDGGVRQWIHHLTEPGELIVDPFAGTGTWGRIAAEMGRRWIGCDVKLGGTETVVADALAAD